MPPVVGRLTAQLTNASAAPRPLVDPNEQRPRSASGNSWLSMLPSALAAGASFIPGVGTVVAGGLGATGEALRQKMAGEELDLGRIALEGGLSAIPGGLGAAAKLAKGATGAKRLRDIEVTTKGLKAKEGVQAAEAGSKGNNLIAKMTQGGRNIQGKARGITPGATSVGQDQLGVDDANRLNDFLNSVGVKTGSAQVQLGKLEQLHQGWVKQLDDAFNARNVAMTPSSITTVKDRIMANLGNIAKLPTSEGTAALVDASGKAIVTAGAGPDHALVKTLFDKLGNVKDVKGLNALRQQIDEGINFARRSATPDPLAEQISTAFRRGISEAMGDLAPETKGINQLLTQSYDAQDFLKNAAKNPPGFNILGMKMGGPAIQAGNAAVGAATTGAAGAAGAGAAGAGGGNSLLRFGKAAAAQGAVRLGAGAAGVYGSPGAAQGAESVAPIEDPALAAAGASGGAMGAEAAPASVAGLTQEMIDEMMLNDISLTGGKNLDKIEKLQNMLDKRSKSASAKPLSAEANKQRANATNGLRALTNLQSMLEKDPSLPLKGLAPGSVGRGITGAGEYEAARQEIIDVLARLRTGAAITKTEEERFKKQLPQVGDSADTIAYKLSLYGDLFNNILSNTAQGSPDLELAGAAL